MTEYRMEDARRALLVLAGAEDPVALEETVFRFGAATPRPSRRDLADLLTPFLDTLKKGCSVNRMHEFKTYRARGSELALVVLVAGADYWDASRHRSASCVTLGAALAPKAARLNPSHAWHSEFKSWRGDQGPPASWWATEKRQDRVQIPVEHVEGVARMLAESEEVVHAHP